MKRKLGFLLVTLLMICLVGAVLTACPNVEPGNKYTVKYERGNSSAKGTAPVARTYSVGEKITLAAWDTFSLAGYDFVGWDDGTETFDANSEYIVPAKNVTLTAKWKEYDEDAIGVVYDANGGTGMLPAIKHYEEDDDFIAAGKGNLTRNGYIFLGWTDGRNYFMEGDEYTVGDYVNNLVKQDGQITLKARWQRTAEYDIQGHWISGTALSGPLHNPEPHVESVTYGAAEVEEYYDTTVSIKYWDTTARGKNNISMVVYSAIRVYDEAGEYKDVTVNSHSFYDLERLKEDDEYVKDDIYVVEETNDMGDTITTKVVFEDKRVKVWFGIINDQEDTASYIEFDEQKALGKSTATSIKETLYACGKLRAMFDIVGYNEAYEWYEGTYIADVWVDEINDYAQASFYVIIEYLGEYMVGFLSYSDEASDTYISMTNVFWYDGEAIYTFGGVKSVDSYKFVKESRK